MGSGVRGDVPTTVATADSGLWVSQAGAGCNKQKTEKVKEWKSTLRIFTALAARGGNGSWGETGC